MTMEKRIMEVLDSNPMRIIELASKVTGCAGDIRTALKHLVRAGSLKRENYYYVLTAKGHVGIMAGSDFLPPDKPDNICLLFYSILTGELTAADGQHLEGALRYKKYAY